jgi:multimeric flavodoxin WrbA
MELQRSVEVINGRLGMILGISASGRTIERDEQGLLRKGVTEELVQYILRQTGERFNYVSLTGKTILGCHDCVSCGSDNVCILEDDWAEVRDQMIRADAIVFGTPIYYGTINAIGHAFLERTYSLRHRAQFPLLGKPNVILTVGTGEDNAAEAYIRRIFRSNYMAEPVGVLRSEGISQCYFCGYGSDCPAGAVVRRHGFLSQIQSYHIPRLPTHTYREAQIIADRLGKILRANKPAESKGE